MGSEMLEVLKEATLFVSNLDIAESFYTNIVGLVVANRVQDQYSLLQYDDGTLLLFQAPPTTTESQNASLALNKAGQISFGISPANISSWRKRSRKHALPIEEDIAWPDGSQSLIFRDPARNRIELKTQTQSAQGLVKEEQLSKHIPGGLNAKWKIYHALRPGQQRDETSGD